MKFFKTFLLITLTLCLLFSATSCSKTGAFSVNKKIVCEVGGEAVTYDEYKYFFFGHYISLYGSDFSSLTEEKFNTVRGLTENSLRRRAFILELCDEYGLKLSRDDKKWVNEYVQQQIDENGGEDKYKAFLLEGRVTGDVFRSQIELTFFYDVYLRDLLSTGIDKRVEMSDSAILADINEENFYRYSQIYYEVGAGELDTEARQMINLAYEKLEMGMDFAYVAEAKWASEKDRAKYKSDWRPNAEKGVYVAKGEKEALLENAVLELEVGSYTKPIWSGQGWHIFIRLPFDSDYVSENLYEAEGGEITLAEKSFARRYLEHIEKESEGIEIEYAKYFTESVSFEMLLSKESLK